MLYPLLFPLADQFQGFNLFRYITFRSGGAVVTALLISFLCGPRIIAWLRSKQANGQPIRLDGPAGHLVSKKGTPTMGGFLILLALTVATLLWADLANPYVWIVLLVTVGFGLIGFLDDYKKLASNTHRGLSGRTKIALEIGVGALACIALGHVAPAPLANTLAVPFFKNVLIHLDGLFVPFGILVVVGASNAVNLT
ncbi:MAG: phospho-N-acetylmuramoyl-pentapeptide-transferase, partial [Stellaceae bacterium]